MGKLFSASELNLRYENPPTDGEIALAEALAKYLPEDCIIFNQPNFNGWRPDIIVLRQGYRAFIIEVKDWRLENYEISNQGKWFLRKDGTEVLSPIEQVSNYKDRLLSLYVEGLLDELHKNSKIFGIITCAVYFHYADKEVMDSIKKIIQNDNSKLGKAAKFIEFYDRSLLLKQSIYRLINESKLNKKHPYFTQDIYRRLFAMFDQGIHHSEEGIDVRLTPIQYELSQSQEKLRQKIRGVAGSGKTMVLVHRAVNAYKRTGSEVLILTFNITLINYIKKKISEVRADFPWNAFTINNYHEFFNSQANRCSLELRLDAYEDTNYFQPAINKLEKYKTILIDEVQDYKTEWIKIVTDYFLAPSGEFVVFADEKQNIYKRELDSDKKIKMPGIKKTWNEKLNKPFRFSGKMTNLLLSYQNEMLKDKYKIDTFDRDYQSEAEFTNSIVEYRYLDLYADNQTILAVIFTFVDKHAIEYSDVTILNSQINLLRQFDYMIRTERDIKTITTFESREGLEEFRSKSDQKISEKDHTEEVSHNKKLHFRMRAGCMKLSTVQSFKGWEVPTAVVIIEPDTKSEETSTAEVIYTGITRARNNLLIINLGNMKYHDILDKVING